MKLPDAAEWNKILWDYFIPQVASGAPIYFAVDSSLLRELAKVHDSAVTPQAVAMDFHRKCRSLFDLKRNSAKLYDHALQTIPGERFSFALLLAIQQILVVETMLSDESLDISENAYFPRYRESLGLECFQNASNPLFGAQFKAIWDQLESEISTHPGASKLTITFFSGTGRDLNRGLPISQALLTTHDLVQVKHWGGALKTTSSTAEILYTLYRIRGKLSRRAQRLISIDDQNLRKKICKQVQSYLNFSESFLAIRQSPRKEAASNRQLIAYLSTEGRYDDFLQLAIRSDTETQLARSEDFETFRTRDVLFVPLIARGDFYSYLAPKDEAGPGDGILLLHREADSQPLRELIDRCFGHEVHARFHELRTNLEGVTGLICDALPAEGIDLLFGGCLSTTQKRNISLHGGLLADERTRIYLIGYPPTDLNWNGVRIPATECVTVGGQQVQIKAFFSGLHLLHEFAVLRLEARGEEVVFAMGASLLDTPTNEFGYPIQDGIIYPAAFSLERGQPSLRGMALCNLVRKQKQLSHEEIRHAIVYPILRQEKKFFPIHPSALEQLILNLEKLELPLPLFDHIVVTLREEGVPYSPLLQKLKLDN